MAVKAFADRQFQLEKRGEPAARIAPMFTIDRASVAAPAKLVAALLAGVLGAGCSQVLGFKEPTLASAEDGGALDGSGGHDAGIPDAPEAKLWLFTTNAQVVGDFGQSTGGRIVADIKCSDLYSSAFTSRQCSHVHAVIQVDNTVDTLDHMAGSFQIPTGAPAFRATDATMISNSWDDLINPNFALLAAVSTSTSAVAFWSGRGVAADRQCSSWTSRDSALFGDAGDATTRSGWLSQASYHCNDLTPHLLCVCW